MGLGFDLGFGEGLGVSGAGFGVWGFEFGVGGLGFRAWLREINAVCWRYQSVYLLARRFVRTRGQCCSMRMIESCLLWCIQAYASCGTWDAQLLLFIGLAPMMSWCRVQCRDTREP